MHRVGVRARSFASRVLECERVTQHNAHRTLSGMNPVTGSNWAKRADAQSRCHPRVEAWVMLGWGAPYSSANCAVKGD
jgi:hypothetical protein